MFTLFHFGFEILKIAIQAAIYSFIILILNYILIKLTKSNRLRLIKFKSIYVLLSVLMFMFSFTYYGNHGLGDEANIPLGHWKSMNSGDGYAYLTLKSGNQIDVDSFFVYNDHLCFASEHAYYSYQLESGKLNKYSNKCEYEIYASTHRLPMVSKFKTFYPQYDAYWNGWRFWLLP